MKLRTFGAALALTVATTLNLSCATGDEEYDEIEEQMAQESDEMIEQEEVMEEDLGDSMAEPEMMEPNEELEEVMEEPMSDLSSEALASELDKLTSPDTGMDDGAADDSYVSNVETDGYSDDSVAPVYEESEPALGTDTLVTDPYSEPAAAADPYSEPAAVTESYSGGAGGGQYVIQPGDTLAKIAGVVFGDANRWRELASNNSITDPKRILPGDVLNFNLDSRAEGFQQAYSSLEPEVIMVQAGDTLSTIAERLFGRADYWKPIWSLNKAEIPNPNVIEPGQVVKYHDPRKMAQTLSDKGYKGLAH